MKALPFPWRLPGKVLERAMKPLIFICVFAGATLVYLISQAASNSEQAARHYQSLWISSAVVSVLLFFLIGYQVLALWKRVRGSVAVIAVMALAVGGSTCAVAYALVQRSIDSWFDVKVERALESGLNLARDALSTSLNDLGAKAASMSSSLDASPSADTAFLSRLREQSGVEEATLVTAGGRLIAQASAEPIALLRDLPGANILRVARSQQILHSLESIQGRGLYLRVIVPVHSPSVAGDVRMLQVMQPVPPALAQQARLLEQGSADYARLGYAREDLKGLIAHALALVTLLAVLTAIVPFMQFVRLSAPPGS